MQYNKRASVRYKHPGLQVATHRHRHRHRHRVGHIHWLWDSSSNSGAAVD